MGKQDLDPSSASDAFHSYNPAGFGEKQRAGRCLHGPHCASPAFGQRERVSPCAGGSAPAFLLFRGGAAGS